MAIIGPKAGFTPFINALGMFQGGMAAGKTAQGNYYAQSNLQNQQNQQGMQRQLMQQYGAMAQDYQQNQFRLKQMNLAHDNAIQMANLEHGNALDMRSTLEMGVPASQWAVEAQKAGMTVPDWVQSQRNSRYEAAAMADLKAQNLEWRAPVAGEPDFIEAERIKLGMSAIANGPYEDSQRADIAAQAQQQYATLMQPKARPRQNIPFSERVQGSMQPVPGFPGTFVTESKDGPKIQQIDLRKNGMVSGSSLTGVGAVGIGAQGQGQEWHPPMLAQEQMPLGHAMDQELRVPGPYADAIYSADGKKVTFDTSKLQAHVADLRSQDAAAVRQQKEREAEADRAAKEQAEIDRLAGESYTEAFKLREQVNKDAKLRGGKAEEYTQADIDKYVDGRMDAILRTRRRFGTTTQPAGPAPLPDSKDQLKDGQIYVNPQGQTGRWNASIGKFEAVN